MIADVAVRLGKLLSSLSKPPNEQRNKYVHVNYHRAPPASPNQ